MSYEVPSDARRDRKTRLEIDRNRNLAKFSPTYSTQTSQENIGTGGTGGSAATGVTTGNLILNPELHIVSVQLSWTSGTGDLAIGDIVDSSTTAWQGKLLFITTGNSTAGTGVFEQQNATAFVDGVQTLTETPADWVGTYTNTSVVTGQLVIISASMIIDDLSGNPTVKTIHGAKNDGQFTTLKPLEGKTLTVASGGNIDTAGFTVADSVFATLQFHEDNITPDASGSWTVALAASGGGTSPPFSDSTDLLKGSADATKLLRFEIDGFTAATTRTITIPDSTTTMAGLGVPLQVWTGTNDFVGITEVRDGTNYFMKNIADPTKKVDWNLSAITTGTTRTITMPDANVTLGAGGGGPEFADDVFRVTGSADASKKLAFEVDGFTASTTRTWTVPNTTTTMAGLGVPSQVWTGTNDFQGITKVEDTSNFSIRDIGDNTKQLQFDVGLISTGTIRTITVPNTTSTMALLGVPSQVWTGTNDFQGITKVEDTSNFTIQNITDNTKQVQFDVSSITTSTIRTWTIPDSTTTMAGLGVLSQTWTGTNDFQGITKVEDTSNFTMQNIADNTKQVRFDLVNISTGTVRTITIPNTTSTMALLGVTSQTWTGTNDFQGITKVEDTTNFTIQNIADNTKQAQFDVSNIATGTIRTITMPDENVTLGSGVPPFIDTTALVKGSGDATKLLRFEIDGFTTGTTRIWTVPNSTTTMAGLGVTSQTWTGTNDFVGITKVRDGVNYFMQNIADNTKQVDWDLSAITTGITRTITMPDADVTLGSGGPEFADNVFRINDNIDATKQIAFQASGISTGTTRTITVPDTSFTLGGLGTSQTWSGFNTFNKDILASASPNIGSGTNKFAAVFVTNVRFDASTQFINGSAAGMRFEVPVNDTFIWEINNVQEAILDPSGFDVGGGMIVATTYEFSSATTQFITADTSGMRFEIPTGDTFNWEINNTDELTLTLSTLDVHGNTITNTGDILNNTDTIESVGNATHRFGAMYSTVYRLPTTVSDSTTRLLSDAGGIEYHALSGDTHAWFINNTLMYSISRSGTIDTILGFNRAGQSILADTNGIRIDVPSGDGFDVIVGGTGTVFFVDANGIDVITFTDASRPTPSAAGAGHVIFNSSDGGLNVSDGTNWRAPSGGWVNT